MLDPASAAPTTDKQTGEGRIRKPSEKVAKQGKLSIVMLYLSAANHCQVAATQEKECLEKEKEKRREERKKKKARKEAKEAGERRDSDDELEEQPDATVKPPFFSRHLI